MWWLSAALAAVLAATLAGCGFQPLYGARSDGTPGRLAVDVAPIAEREGQVLRAALRRSFDFARAPDYSMQVALAEQVNAVAIDQAGDVTRRRMTLSARWRLMRLDAPAGAKPIEGVARVFEAYNVFASDFANLTAERAARERAAIRLADMIAAAATARARGA